jgi:hypothetical protein
MTAARGLGRLLREFGEGGLKIADSRELVETMDGAPVGDVPGVVVVGPMDHAQQAAADVLLKTLEEFDPDQVRPVLWANDETEVSPTIRSRCLRRWCPGVWVTDEERLGVARELVEAALRRYRASVIELLKDQDSRGILESAAVALCERGIDTRTRSLWLSLRAVTRVHNPSATEVLAAFLLEGAA